MIITKKLGRLPQYETRGKVIDWLWLEWYETNKRILHKRTATGREVIIKILKEAPEMMQGDVLYEDDAFCIVIDIHPCDVIVLTPKNFYEMASVCYEIGNRHLPLFYVKGEVLVPYEAPLFRLLKAAGFEPVPDRRKLIQPLKTTVAPHSDRTGSSLFSRIMKLTNSNTND